MLTKDENALLTSVGAGTPGGEFMRRYWHPVGLSADVGDEPTLVRILGEDLVLFRSKSGGFGLMQARCPHRGASLVYGCVENAGLRCRYHGWLFSTEGRCLEQPGESGRSTLKEKILHPAYETRELGGLIFAYLGPKPAPVLPRFDSLVREDGVRKATIARIVACNYLQIIENSMDPVHLPFLHGDAIKVWATIPEFTVEDTKFGIKQTQYRPGPIPKQRYVRSVEYILPCSRMLGIPASDDDLSTPTTVRTIWAVPIDDTHTIEFEVRFQPSHGGRKLDYKFDPGPGDFEVALAKPFQKYQVEGGGYTGYPEFFGAQDQLIQLSQGPIVPRELEHLGTSDRGVILARKVLRQAIEDVRQGRDPRGVLRGDGDAIVSFDLEDHLVNAEAV